MADKEFYNIESYDYNLHKDFIKRHQFEDETHSMDVKELNYYNTDIDVINTINWRMERRRGD